MNNGQAQSDEIMAEYDFATHLWKVHEHSDADKASKVTRAFDGDPHTVWLAKKQGKVPPSLAIDLGEELSISGFTYMPALDENQQGNIYSYDFYTSKDGLKWTKVLNKRNFGNLKNNPIRQQVKFSKRESARFIKIDAIAGVEPGVSYISIGEIGVIVD
ncbi:MAG: discoidin domain-containing protein [Sphingobacterium sp.]